MILLLWKEQGWCFVGYGLFVWVPGRAFIKFVFFLFLFGWLRVHTSLVTPMRRKIIVSFFTSGIVYQEGRKRQTVTWEQILYVERLTIKPWIKSVRYYKIFLKDMRKLTLLAVIAQVQELGEAVESEIVKRRLPQAQADYVADKSVVFTGLCLNQRG